MKNHIISLVASFALLISLMGCQDNFRNNPVSSKAFEKVGPTSAEPLQGSITLANRLVDPIKVNNYYLLNGKIKYSQELFIKTGATEPKYEVRLDVAVDAVLTDNLEPKQWDINAKSKDRFYLDVKGSRTLVKSYPINGTTDLFTLVCKFEVDSKGLKLANVKLNSPVVYNNSQL